VRGVRGGGFLVCSLPKLRSFRGSRGDRLHLDEFSGLRGCLLAPRVRASICSRFPLTFEDGNADVVIPTKAKARKKNESLVALRRIDEAVKKHP
jgi:hypothetical protein